MNDFNQTTTSLFEWKITGLILSMNDFNQTTTCPVILICAK